MWNRKTFAGLTLIMGFTFGCSKTYACEIANLMVSPITSSPVYDIQQGGVYPLIAEFQVSANITGDECTFRILTHVDDGVDFLSSITAKRLNFEWHAATGSERIGGWLGTLTTAQPSMVLRMRFSADQWVPATQYRGDISVFVVDATLARNLDIPHASYDLFVDVIPATQIQFYGISQQRYELNIGRLHSGKVISQIPRLYVKSNAGYTVSFASEHFGRLRHESNDAQWDIDYRLTANEHYLDLTQTKALLRSAQFTSSHLIPLHITIGDTSERIGGTYSDSLQISISPSLSTIP
ncbi:hypothetical protein [Alteromonas ponticola]|uniref:Spore coat protein U domain-containing protein n=1 Tax=Alteromonas ponticola TaxID=2720613 RepID=A0ABX1R484_9ALTE|nr:hypothetical protein [Alteromonas ponticola]NMH60466.1 hypothetical protein [Alteromonas ponticola]